MKYIAIIVIIALFLIPLPSQAEDTAPIPPEMVEMVEQDEEVEENDDQNGLVVVNEKTQGESLVVWQ